MADTLTEHGMRGRIKFIPLRYENKDFSVEGELILDHSSIDVGMKTSSGEIKMVGDNVVQRTLDKMQNEPIENIEITNTATIEDIIGNDITSDTNLSVGDSTDSSIGETNIYNNLYAHSISSFEEDVSMAKDLNLEGELLIGENGNLKVDSDNIVLGQGLDANGSLDINVNTNINGELLINERLTAENGIDSNYDTQIIGDLDVLFDNERGSGGTIEADNLVINENASVGSLDVSELLKADYAASITDPHKINGTLEVDRLRVSNDIGHPTGDYVHFEKGVSIGEDIKIFGNLTVMGGTTSVETSELNVENTHIILNEGQTDGEGVSSGNAGITINRGTLDDSHLEWKEDSGRFELLEGTSLAGLNVSELIVESPDTFQNEKRAAVNVLYSTNDDPDPSVETNWGIGDLWVVYDE